MYEFVVGHFLTACSKDAMGFKTVVDVKIADEMFSVEGLQVIERNYLNIYIYDRWSGKRSQILKKDMNLNLHHWS